MFRKKNGKEKRIVAFVDYESWFYALENLHKQKPDIASWFAELSRRGRVIDVIFFGDFSNPALKDEIGRIRPYSNKIIETRNPNPKFKKDYTDFIMLDNIYQRALSSSSDIDIFVLFSGDGHFSSVASFLKNYGNIEVGIFGVSGAFSSLLKNSCDWWVEVPSKASRKNYVYELLFDALREAEKNRSNLIHLAQIVDNVAKKHKLSAKEVMTCLQELIEKGLVSKQELIVNKNEQVAVLRAVWDQIKAAGFAKV
jgi:hypothetical protein